ncbi:hypothetical protein B566_EDAN010641, partial [Ephemera danica]
DDLLFNILSDSGQIIHFFQSIFGFLYRRTDFFKVQENQDDAFGFPPGVAENLILKIFRQWQDLARQNEMLEQFNRLKSDGVAPPAVEELVISDEPTEAEKPTTKPVVAESKREQNYESHNGAVRPGYSWSQSICELDVTVEVPTSVTRGKQVRVELTSQSLGVWHEGSEEPLVAGELPWRTKREETVWSLVPGKHVQVHLEKCEERWWDSLLTSEPKIDLGTIDPSRPLDEMSQSEQMKVQELVWSEQQRVQAVPSSTQPCTDVEAVLKLAWNQEGSPFKDVPYDPSLVTFGSAPPPPSDM